MTCQVWWLTPVIPALWEAKAGGSSEVGIRDQPAQRGKSPSLLKIQNQLDMVVHACNPSYLGGRGRRIAWTREVEVAVSWDHAIVLQAQQQEQNCLKKKFFYTHTHTYSINQIWVFMISVGSTIQSCAVQHGSHEPCKLILSTWLVAYMTEKLNFSIYLI